MGCLFVWSDFPCLLSSKTIRQEKLHILLYFDRVTELFKQISLANCSVYTLTNDFACFSVKLFGCHFKLTFFFFIKRMCLKHTNSGKSWCILMSHKWKVPVDIYPLFSHACGQKTVRFSYDSNCSLSRWATTFSRISRSCRVSSQAFLRSSPDWAAPSRLSGPGWAVGGQAWYGLLKLYLSRSWGVLGWISATKP